MYRRFDYDERDRSGAPKPTAATTTPPPPETTTSSKSSQETTAASTSASTEPVATPSPNNGTRPNESITPFASVKNSNSLVNEAEKKTAKANFKKQITTRISSPNFEKQANIIKPNGIKKNDPVRDQVAQELMNEIKHISPEKSLRTGRKGQSGRTQSSKMKPSLQTKGSPRDLAKDYVKTTRRIHLERSTRFPIPLPENHAFCYTNPKSALCRTPL